MKVLLTADLHLTDKDADAYRWDALTAIHNWCVSNPKDLVIIAGDLTDRKDRHSAILVNTLADMLQETTSATGCHDTPLNGPPYWSVLQHMPGVQFVDQPFCFGSMWLLPYSADPATDWANLSPWGPDNVFIMHQTVTGVLGNNGYALVNDHMPDLPEGALIYSGDIHNPQDVAMPNGALVRYIGAPHHINFGDNHPCRMLELEYRMPHWGLSGTLPLHPPSKHMLDVERMDQLYAFPCKAGDQARVRFDLDVNAVDQWPAIQDQVRLWAAKAGVQLFGIEPVLHGAVKVAPGKQAPSLLKAPVDVLKAFAKAEKLDSGLMDVALQLVEETRNA
jgi:hypothetical protein